MQPTRFQAELPDWVGPFVRDCPQTFADGPERMALAIELASRNVRSGTGGPFGAAIFELPSGRLVSVGVNVVVASGLSLAHAEIMALALAQRAAGVYSLARSGTAHQLVTSCEPCAMCFGALPWAGLTSLVCGARAEDAIAVGFDEGPKTEHWIAALRSRGISVETDVLRADAVAALRAYAESGGVLYG